jgi:hypothetical protein
MCKLRVLSWYRDIGTLFKVAPNKEQITKLQITTLNDLSATLQSKFTAANPPALEERYGTRNHSHTG